VLAQIIRGFKFAAREDRHNGIPPMDCVRDFNLAYEPRRAEVRPTWGCYANAALKVRRR
jgi:hypothetical protein